MNITVITPSYNQGHFIGQTIESVISQQFNGILEYLVIDGGSADSTLEILHWHRDRLKWVSEPDRGLADAVNKGVALAEGEIIGWINSDDLYLPGALEAVSAYFAEHPECGWLFGKCRIIDSAGMERWRWITRYKNLGLKFYSRRKLLRENFISQPAVFFRKDLFDRAGGLDISLRYAMDYDLWLRFSALGDPGFIDRELSAFRRHGASKSETGTRDQFLEQYRVALNHSPACSDRLIHRFNIMKIIFAYRFLGLFFRF
jgi:glycosyltransferase involved in cell wall biosynthesis